MRTTVSLDSISALVEGRHANPFDVLGPHEVETGGRSARAVRAYLPNSQQVWFCLLYTSDAADERSSVDLGGRRIIKKKNIDHTINRYAE